MTRARRWIEVMHAGALMATLLVASLLLADSDDFGAGAAVGTAQAQSPIDEVKSQPLPDGRAAIADATGHLVPVAPYGRIIAGSTAIRGILIDLIALDRVVAVSDYGLDDVPNAHRFAGLSRIADIGRIEDVVARKPDLVLVHAMSSADKVARLRESGLEVFDLGEQRGLDMFIQDVHTIAALLDLRERGRQYTTSFLLHMRGLAADIPQSERKRGMYLSFYGNRMFGGTLGSSFHDVLVHAGLVDAAAQAYREWPQYDVEQLLGLDPEVIVTRDGAAAELCRQAGLDQLRVCRGQGQIVEVPSAVLSDPGPGMLQAAEMIRVAVHGARPPLER